MPLARRRPRVVSNGEMGGVSDTGRILVTGAAGLIGSAVVWKLNRQGIEDIIAVDHLGNSEKGRNLRALRFREYLEALRPLNMYGYSKQLLDLWVRREGLLARCAGLKYSNVFGPNEAHKAHMRSVVMHAFEPVRDTGVVRLFRTCLDLTRALAAGCPAPRWALEAAVADYVRGYLIPGRHLGDEELDAGHG